MAYACTLIKIGTSKIDDDREGFPPPAVGLRVVGGEWASEEESLRSVTETTDMHGHIFFSVLPVCVCISLL